MQPLLPLLLHEFVGETKQPLPVMPTRMEHPTNGKIIENMYTNKKNTPQSIVITHPNSATNPLRFQTTKRNPIKTLPKLLGGIGIAKRQQRHVLIGGGVP